MVGKVGLLLGVLGLLFAVAGQPFYTKSQTATGVNHSRHLALDPVTGWLHLVYAYGEPESDICYPYSTDQGDNWSASMMSSAGGSAAWNPASAAGEATQLIGTGWTQPDARPSPVRICCA